MPNFVGRVATVLSLVVLAGCGDLTGPKALPIARQVWNAQNLTYYQYVGTRSCFCLGPHGPVTVIVNDNQVVRVIDHSTTSEVSIAGWLTIDEMFEEAERAIADDQLNHIEFDESAGYPTVVDFGRWEIDGGMRRGVSNLRSTVNERGT